MVENNVGDTFEAAMSRNRDNGKRHWSRYGRIDGDEALDAPFQKQVRVSIQKFFVVGMSHREEKESVLAKVLFDSANDHRSVGIANLRDDSDCEGSLDAQRAGKKIRAVIQLASRIQNSSLGALRD
jgi:hypothetical protein